MSEHYIMSPDLRRALRDALAEEPWDPTHKAEVAESWFAVPDGPIIDPEYDRVFEETGGEDPYVDAHVITAIEYFGLEHLARGPSSDDDYPDRSAAEPTTLVDLDDATHQEVTRSVIVPTWLDEYGDAGEWVTWHPMTLAELRSWHPRPGTRFAYVLRWRRAPVA